MSVARQAGTEPMIPVEQLAQHLPGTVEVPVINAGGWLFAVLSETRRCRPIRAADIVWVRMFVAHERTLTAQEPVPPKPRREVRHAMPSAPRGRLRMMLRTPFGAGRNWA
ncbi:MAG: hypothetical protein ACRDUA_14315 [Micromonosporaceae bacterium]